MYCKEMIKKNYCEIYPKDIKHAVKRICPMCNDEFIAIKGKNITTCSEYCSKRRLSLLKMKGKYFQCDVCDKLIWVGPKKFNQKHHYCSKKCTDLGWSIYNQDYNLRKLKNRPKDYGDNWQKMRNLARKRDQYTCQMCGIKEGTSEKDYHQQLSVHHIKPFVLHDNYLEANKLDNLICYCEPCHRKAHMGKNHHSQYIKK